MDFKNEIINVADPKHKNPRKVFMTKAVKEMFKKSLPESPNELIFKDRWHGEEIESVSRAYQRGVDRLGFNKGIVYRRQKVVFHTLRHTSGSWLAIQGTPLHTIAELMGHKTLSMTQRYAHLIPDVKKQATLALETSFEASRNGKKIIPLATAKEPPVMQQG